MRFKRMRIALVCTDHMRLIMADVIGDDWAVHPDLEGDGHTVTHAPSSRLARKGLPWETACELARKLAEEVSEPWKGRSRDPMKDSYFNRKFLEQTAAAVMEFESGATKKAPMATEQQRKTPGNQGARERQSQSQV